MIYKDSSFISYTYKLIKYKISGILRDKTMDDKFIYVPYDNLQNYPPLLIKNIVKKVWTLGTSVWKQNWFNLTFFYFNTHGKMSSI